MQITTADLDFRENAHTIKSERKNLICWSIVLVLSLILFFITQVTVAYKRKVEELKSQELDEEEANNKLGLLKVSCRLVAFWPLVLHKALFLELLILKFV